MTKRLGVSIGALIVTGLILLVATRPSTPRQPNVLVSPPSLSASSSVQALTTPVATTGNLMMSSTVATATQTTISYNSHASSQNRSSLHLASGGNMMLLTDPKGRQTGYDITTGKVLQQIPNSNFSSEATTNIEDTKYPAPVDYFIDIHNPLDGIYELTLIRGENSNYYDLTMVTFTEYGDRESTDEIKGSMISGSDRVFQIDFTSASNVSSTVSLIK